MSKKNAFFLDVMILKKELIRSSETSVSNELTQRSSLEMLRSQPHRG
jgi:hypothetical protein